MFGPRITTIFTSRWKALHWALGVLLLAYCSVPSKETENTDIADAKALAQAQQAQAAALKALEDINKAQN